MKPSANPVVKNVDNLKGDAADRNKSTGKLDAKEFDVLDRK
jgi:hypothetical protein